MSRTQVPSQPSSQVTLTERQTALIDRFRASIRVATGTEPRREVAIGTLFQAFEKAESNLALFLFDAMRDQREP
jgi:Mg-chelatase subunit ChlI